MSWKPIPQEAKAKSEIKKIQKKTHIRACHLSNIIKKEIPHPNISYRFLQSVSSKLIDFVKKEKKYKINDLSDLITDLNKTIIKLQKKKMFLIEKEANKYKKRPRK